MNFSELCQKDVINMLDGKKLGRPDDLMINDEAVVEALIIPAPMGMMNIFKREHAGIVVPWNRIKRIGDDVILVEVEDENFNC